MAEMKSWWCALLSSRTNQCFDIFWWSGFWTDWLMSCAHREHDQIFRKPRQPALSHPHDHSWPGERRQGLASGEEPRTWGSEGGRSGQQDGVRDLPDTTSGYQGEPSKYAFNSWLLSGTWVILVTSPEVIHSIQERSYLKILIAARAPSQTHKPQYSYLLSLSHCSEMIIQMYSSIPSVNKRNVLFFSPFYCISISMAEKRQKRKDPQNQTLLYITANVRKWRQKESVWLPFSLKEILISRM